MARMREGLLCFRDSSTKGVKICRRRERERERERETWLDTVLVATNGCTVTSQTQGEMIL